jgi:ABC-type transporter Mla subunit MlaD
MSRHRIILLAAVLAGACASEHENVVHVIAEQAPGLKKSARVQYRGVDVGLVKQVYFTPAGVRIDLLLQRNDVPIRTQDTVRISAVGAFGEQVIDIRPGVQTAPLIARGATLPKAQPDTTVSLPIGVWRSIVKSLGFTPDSLMKDSATTAAAGKDSSTQPAAAKPDSTAARKP